MTENEFSHLTDEQLRDLEFRLYESAVEGDDNWFERDKIYNEMNRRGMCK